jgi:D-3-phosphoglycerate dehydrogenase
MIKVLVADKFEKVGLDGLRELNCNVQYSPDLSAADLPVTIRDFDPKILIVRSKKVNAAALEAGPGLSLVIRAGAGIDNIDVAVASKHGVFVSNCPGKNSIAVAELVLGLILTADRRIADQVGDLRRGTWNKSEYSKARGLHGRTLGIVGLGQIGREIARRAQSFGLRVVAWSRQLTIEDATRLAIGYCQSPLEVAQQSDIVSINVAGTPETRHLVNREFLDAMRPGAYLINTSRGTVVDEAALADAIKAKGIRAGLDVYEQEPAGGGGEFHPAIADLPGVFGTHHVGASTEQAQVAIAHEVIRIVQEFQATGGVPNCVNRLAKSAATHVLNVRHRNRPGVLAHVFTVLSEAQINVEEVENIIYHGAETSLARIHLSAGPGVDIMNAMHLVHTGNPHILTAEVRPID